MREGEERKGDERRGKRKCGGSGGVVDERLEVKMEERYI